MHVYIERLRRLCASPRGKMRREDEAIVAARDARVQLQRIEIREVVRALRRFERCRLLVFGTGYDSPLWEALNSSGTTVFLEHHPEWSAAVQTTLKRSPVHLVRYETRLSEWMQQLSLPPRLPLDLPASITSHQWDVILVDGPPGSAYYRDDQGREAPGRMQSIFAASQLVAPSGYVFVHDCDRPAEHAFVLRYLTRSREFVKVKGRAELRGFYFAPARSAKPASPRQ